MTQQNNLEGGFYSLSGDNVQITYEPNALDGQSHFTYQDADAKRDFTGDEIRLQQTELGTILSVTLKPSVDAGATILNLIMPAIRLQGEQEVPFQTLAIITQTYGILPFHAVQPVYQVMNLNGTAQLDIL
ncbi:MAG: hypothetical protein NVSMB33_14500 [Ktedonobacteraceae bacterium]